MGRRRSFWKAFLPARNERIMMAEKLDQKEIASFEEVLMSNVYTQEALINLLEAKGIIKKQELLDEIKKIKKGIY